jgi:glycosyltransferase involved in cell wall biosynthesis
MSACVSIIIPTYNGREFIQQTIDSCLRQTSPNIEVIVIDDLSTDNTRDILSLYESKVSIVLNNTNLGIVKNINKGLEQVTTKYFMLLGHDDVLPENHIELMLSEFDDDVISVHCNSVIINAEGNETGLARNDAIQLKKTDNCLFNLSIGNFISSCGMIHQTDVFNKTGGWDERYLHYGEWLYYIKSLSYGRIKYTSKTKAYYRRHDTNITNTFKDKIVIKKLNIYRQHCRTLAHKSKTNTAWENLIYLSAKLKLMIKRVCFE